MKKILKFILKKISRKTLKKYQPKVIVVSGSVGKTSTKEAIFCLLKKFKRCRATPKNYNNELGVPLAILGNWKEITSPIIVFWLKVFLKSIWNLVFFDKNYPQILILELAADRPGDIEYFMDFIKPDIGLITTIGEVPSHIEFYPNLSSLAKEKAKIIEKLPSNGVAILNFDDPLVLSMKEKTKAKIITYGFNQGADFQILNYQIEFGDDFKGTSMKFFSKGSLIPFRIRNAFGRPIVLAIAASFCVGIEEGLNLIEISNALDDFSPLDHRMSLIKGIKNTWIIDDCYNASPIAVKSALEVLDKIKGRRKIIVLGDMRELGKYSYEAHFEIGKEAAKISEVLFFIGNYANIYESGVKESGLKREIYCFESSDKAKFKIQEILREGDIILIKGSRAIKMEKIIEEIKYQ